MSFSKVAATVILYHPESSFIHNILSYSNEVSKLYIIDNSENTNALSANDLKQFSNWEYIYNNKNIGIAAALNLACIKAINEGFDYLLTMDQDSYFDAATIQQYFNCIDEFKEKKSAALFGVNYQHQSTNLDCAFKNVHLLITSGSVINLHLYKKIGGFDEEMFIDFVDTDYCLRAIQNDFGIIEFCNISMHHQIGKTSVYTSLKTFRNTQRSIHSSYRLYYMARNYFYLKSKYKSEFKAEINIHKKDLLIRIKNKLLYNTGRLKTIRILYKACKDFKNKKMGKQII